MSRLKMRAAAAGVPSMLVAAGLASTLAMAACGSGSVRSSPTTSRAPAPSASTHITAYSLNTDKPDLTVLLSGAVGDYGTAVPATSQSAAHPGELELKLTRGTFRIAIADIDRKFIHGTSHEPIFPRTCSTFVEVTASVPIVPGSGTGRYRGIAGSFAMTLEVNEVHATPCMTSLRLLRQIVVLSGAGAVTLR